MFTNESLDRLAGATVYDSAGDKIGTIGAIYVENDSDQPSFVTVSTGLFGTSENFVPLEGARMDGDDLRVQYSKDQVKDAPRVDAEVRLAPAEEDRLYEHYQLQGGRPRTADADPAETGGFSGPVGEGADGFAGPPGAAETPDDTDSDTTGRTRLRKYTTDER